MGPITDKGWRAVRRQRLRTRRFDDEVVVYDDASGDTHLFDDLAGRVLEALLVTSATFDELLALVPDDDAAAPSLRREQVREVLMRLRRLGIVKPLRK